MNLYEVKLNTICVVKSINISDEKVKIRLMELGLIVGENILVKNRSSLKKTLLIAFNSSCFTIKDVIAREIGVEYA
ncbi:MAG: ferrous iron transport protein A [Clostridia bacterium]|nr:ferrous iron transport protein A [Clostridia bacterium]